MNLQHKPTMRNRVQHANPSLEALEGRHLLTCAVNVWPNGAFDGNALLHIHGDPKGTPENNTIKIYDNGTGARNNVALQCDGLWHDLSQVSVSQVRVFAGDGYDTVTYNLTGDLRFGRSIWVDLGRQNDSFTANFGSYNTATSLLPGSFMGLTVNGGSGNDTITINADRGTNIGVGATLGMSFYGGDDMDTIGIYYSGELDGLLYVFADGNNHNDTVRAWLTLGPGSTGSVGRADHPCQVRGSAGTDTVDFRIQDNSSGQATIFAQLIDTDADSTWIFTPNVEVIW
jgi:hypothetical protein